MVLSDLQKRYSKNDINNAIEIDTRIEECEERIDALVYKLYDFSEKELDTTMKWLSIRQKYQQKVVEYFKAMI
jgi:hypothetical protein